MGVKWNGSKVLEEASQAVDRGLAIVSEKIVGEMQQSMKLPKHGRDYRGTAAGGYVSDMPAGKRKKFGYWRNQSSAPYESPAVQQGRVYGSLQWQKLKAQRFKVGAFGADCPSYALFLEIGTSKMDERPYLRPALHKYTGRTGEELFRDLMK